MHKDISSLSLSEKCSVSYKDTIVYEIVREGWGEEGRGGEAEGIEGMSQEAKIQNRKKATKWFSNE